MAHSEAIETLQATLQPLEELQGEQTQLESWVHESFSALEKLHEELSDWQSELARKQTEIDLREDALERSIAQEGSADGSLVEIQKQLEEAQEEIKQLEDENAEQLQEFEELESQHNKLQADYKTSKQHAADLAGALESERAKIELEQDQWVGEFREIRRQLERKFMLLEDRMCQGNQEIARDYDDDVFHEEDQEVSTRSAELRKRAQNRLAAKRRRQRNTEESD